MSKEEVKKEDKKIRHCTMVTVETEKSMVTVETEKSIIHLKELEHFCDELNIEELFKRIGIKTVHNGFRVIFIFNKIYLDNKSHDFDYKVTDTYREFMKQLGVMERNVNLGVIRHFYEWCDNCRDLRVYCCETCENYQKLYSRLTN
jgi:hypothetical protein